MNQQNIEKTESINPATGEILGYTGLNTIGDLQMAVKKAKIAQKGWAVKSFHERAKHLLLMRDFITQNSERIADIISKNNGKTHIDALSTEVIPAAMSANYYAKKSKKLLKRRKLSAGNILFFNKKSYIDRVPFGVIGIISPWNYPFSIPFQEILMALISGNAVICKVATQTQEVGKIIQEVVNAANLPVGLFYLLNIPGNIAGDAFIESGINKLFFTGSVPVGKKLMKKASEKLLPLSLELGGNDAMIVCEDANVYRAALGAAWAGFSNAGQSCGGVERIYVLKGIYDEFMKKLNEVTSALSYGADKEFNVEIGSITTEKQLKTIKEHVKDALDKGAKISSEAKKFEGNEKGFFHPPMVLENVDDSMITMKCETFGPIVAVMKVDSLEEAIERANNSDLGLTASIWTNDKKKAHKAAAKLEAGAITINDHLMSHGLSETPWGGFKESGLGRTHGYLGLEEMTQPRVVVDDIMPFLQKDMWWYPHDKSVYTGLSGVLNFLYAKSLSQKFKGMINLIKVFSRSFIKE
jgi:acyl-CoA reductase-like NAD-dependent aldehyde dehydrogenase